MTDAAYIKTAMKERLACPDCGEDVASIAPCQVAHDCCDPENGAEPLWCEDREGVCACGASLRVLVQEPFASLVLKEPA